MALPKSLGRGTPGSSDKSLINASEGLADQLQTLDQKPDNKIGAAPKERLKNAAALHSFYTTLLQSDIKSAFNRTVLENALDGAPPQDEQTLAANGMSWVYNLNFLSGDTQLQAALTAYSDLIEASTELVAPEFYPGKVAPEDMAETSDVIAEEHARLIRENSNFYAGWERLGSEFTKHGTGFGYFADDECWEWDAAGWREFLMPRRTKVGEEKIPALIWQHDYRVHELYRYITDEEYTNWDVQEVKKAIVYACRTPTKDRPWMVFWPDLEILLKNNDLTFSYGKAEEVKCIHALIREFDGSVSFYIGLVNGNNTEHLYKEVSRYKHMKEAVTTFTLGVGNGTYHSIRGLAWKMYPFTQTIDRLWNKQLTQTDLSMSIVLQPLDAESLDDLSITLQGPVAYMPPADRAQVIDRKIPDVGTQGLPVIQDLRAGLANASGQFQSTRGQAVSAPLDNRHNVSKFQYAAEQEQAGSLTNNSVNRFYRSVDQLFNEQFRRIQKISPTDDRYPEVKDFYQRCKERGVPSEIIKKAVRKVTAVRAIGNGSPQMRALAYDELTQMIGFLDETGRNLAVRDRIAGRLGRMAADRYLPKQKRLAPDAQIANLENAVLINGPLDALPDQNHAVHAGIHVPKFQEVLKDLVTVREQNPEADFTPLAGKLQYALNLHAHSAQHVQAMSTDPTRVKDAKAYAAALEQGANLLAGFQRQLQQQERHHVLYGGGQQPQGGGMPPEDTVENSPEATQAKLDAINASTRSLQAKAQLDEEKLQQQRELHQQELELASAKVADVQQKIRARDIELATKIRVASGANKAAGVVGTPV